MPIDMENQDKPVEGRREHWEPMPFGLVSFPRVDAGLQKRHLREQIRECQAEWHGADNVTAEANAQGLGADRKKTIALPASGENG